MMNTKSLCLIFVLGVALTITAAAAENWCVAKAGVPEQTLNMFMDLECAGGSRTSLDCTSITPGAPCFEPNNVAAHASYVLNLYYKSHGVCVSDLGIIVNKNPSTGGCKYP